MAITDLVYSDDVGTTAEVVGEEAPSATGGGVFDRSAPLIFDLEIEEISAHSITLTWKTSESAKGRVEYVEAGSDNVLEKAEEIYFVKHETVLDGLSDSTTYQFRIVQIDHSGNESVTDWVEVTTMPPPDTSPPSNVRALTATVVDGAIQLSWVNPVEEDFFVVRIEKCFSGYCHIPGTGVLVFEGSVEQVLDSAVQQGTDYFYTAFSYDSSWNASSGAIVSARIEREAVEPEVIVKPEDTETGAQEEVSEEPVEAPSQPIDEALDEPSEIIARPTDEFPEEAEESLPEPIEYEFPASAISANAAVNTVSLYYDPDQGMHIFRNSAFVISLAANALPAGVLIPTFELNGSQYMLRYRKERGAYEVEIVSPSVAGAFKGELQVPLVNGSELRETIALEVASFGEVFEVHGKRAWPVAGASVTLYTEGDGGLTIWPAEKFNQTNPQQIDDRGVFGFIVPAGTYALRVDADGYVSEQLATRYITDNIINDKVRLTPVVNKICTLLLDIFKALIIFLNILFKITLISYAI
ncbi:MAG: hypothetical protein ABIA47_01185 [bacterium]